MSPFLPVEYNGYRHPLHLTSNFLRLFRTWERSQSHDKRLPPFLLILLAQDQRPAAEKQPANSKCLYSLPPLVDGRSAGRCAGSRAGTKGGKAGRACPACRRCKQLQCLPLSTERGRTADIWQQSSQQRTRGLLAQGGDQCEGLFHRKQKYHQLPPSPSA